MSKPKFAKGARVQIKGRKGIFVVHWPMLISNAQIINGQFVLVDVPMYKFKIEDKNDYFFAYEEDVKPAERKGP